MGAPTHAKSPGRVHVTCLGTNPLAPSGSRGTEWSKMARWSTSHHTALQSYSPVRAHNYYVLQFKASAFRFVDTALSIHLITYIHRHQNLRAVVSNIMPVHGQCKPLRTFHPQDAFRWRFSSKTCFNTSAACFRRRICACHRCLSSVEIIPSPPLRLDLAPLFDRTLLPNLESGVW